jgi:tocopherol O-methyltransferase
LIYQRAPQPPENVSRHYDDLDTFYRDIWGDHVHHGLWLSGHESHKEAVRQLVAYALSRAGVIQGASVCDVGCGYGATAHLLKKEYGASVTALTISRRQYEYAARTYGSSNCRFLLRDWMDNELPDSAFDLVLVIESLSHMPDKHRAFAEAFRVLKPGGKLVVMAWLAGNHVGPLQRRHLLEGICTEGRLPSMLDRSEMIDLMGQVGIDVKSSELLTSLVRKTWTICLRRLLQRLATDSRYRRYLIDPSSSDRRFLLTLFHIIAAYRTGAMQYGLFVGTRPDPT